MVADFILEHRECLIPPWASRSGLHYGSRLMLCDAPISPYSGELEARLLYEQDSAYDPRDESAAVRRIVWDRATDWTRCSSRNVSRPTISSVCYRVNREGLIRINLAMRAFAKRIGPLQFDEIVLDQLPRPTGPFRKARVPARSRRVIFRAPDCIVDLNFVNKWVDPPLNRSWQRVWETLGPSMTEANKIGRVRSASHGMTPGQYARLLAGGKS
jgi:hypothetical protein